MKKARLSAVIFIITICCAAMAAADMVFDAPYVWRSLFKIVLFLALPLLYSLFDKGVSLGTVFRLRKSGIGGALILGVTVYAVILAAYFLLRDVVDFSQITELLATGEGVTKRNIIWVSLYISFVNSLLEEFFFRGFAFLELKKLSSRRFAYIFGAGVFAAYHISIIGGWFSPGIFLLVMAGLFAGGLIFNFLNEKNGNIYASWMVHMFANFAINTVGLILFEVI